MCVLVYLRTSVGKIRRAITMPFVSQGLQARDMNACVLKNFKANTAKVKAICSSIFRG